MTKTTRVSAVALICLSLLLPSVAQQPKARAVADWLKAGVVYEINPRTFSAEGNFRGIEKRLDELKDLGVTILWLMPIHPLGQAKKKGSIGSPYAVRDYYAINPAYGNKEDLKSLVREAHRRDLKVIIDIVANHTSWDSVLMKNPAFYRKDAAGHVVPPVPEWADVAGLDYSNPELRTYMIAVLKYWVTNFDLDGFRCDVAGEIPTDFWEKARAELSRIKPGIIMIAEANKPELLLHAFDLDYAWPFHSTLTDVLQNGMPATAVVENWSRERSRYPSGALEMRFSDNHDERRAIARFGERGALAASALVFTMDGVPMLYNGMEVGDTTESGAPALFENLPVFWPIAERRANFRSFYTQMIALRRAHPALQQGETAWVSNSDPDRVLTFFRRDKRDAYFVAINLSNRPFSGTADVPAGNYVDETPELGAGERNVTLPKLKLNAWEFRIYHQPPASSRMPER